MKPERRRKVTRVLLKGSAGRLDTSARGGSPPRGREEASIILNDPQPSPRLFLPRHGRKVLVVESERTGACDGMLRPVAVNHRSGDITGMMDDCLERVGAVSSKGNGDEVGQGIFG